MSDFIFLYRSTDEQRTQARGTPERAQKTMQAWVAWMSSLEASGNLKEPGHPLETGGSVVRGSKKVVTDGPYVEAKDLVLGFTIVKANDLGHAVELSRGCPILEGGGSVEVRPLQQMNLPKP
jgi:hypothetical protein